MNSVHLHLRYIYNSELEIQLKMMLFVTGLVGIPHKKKTRRIFNLKGRVKTNMEVPVPNISIKKYLEKEILNSHDRDRQLTF